MDEPRHENDGGAGAALGPEVGALLRVYREAHSLPAEVGERVLRRLRAAEAEEAAGAAEGAESRRRRAWLGLGGIAAAAALILVVVELLPGRGPEVRSRAGEGPWIAPYVAELQRATQGVVAAESSRRAGAASERGVANGVAEHPGDDVASGDPRERGEAGEAGEKKVGTGPMPQGVERRRGARGSEAVPPSGVSGVSGAAEGDQRGLDLAGERELLRAAWRALQRGDDRGAATALERHRRDYPVGILVQEREAIAVILGCRAGDAGEAAAARFAADHGRSPWLAAIRRACRGE